MIAEILSLLFLAAGTVFILISAVGVVRMPDIYLRMSASTKSSTLGVGFILLGAAAYFFHDLGVFSRAIAIIVFLLLTAPVSAHMIGRAAYHTGVPLWRKSRYDDLYGKFDPQGKHLDSSLESTQRNPLLDEF
ncbi:MAG: Na(+)/H(+) antiporter subunit G [Anaerolineae bacterium]|nr:Na(+)/H(+) antiporter subunit G [Anaerolineae bacterium]